MAGSSAVKEEDQEDQARQGQGGSSGQRGREQRGQSGMGEQAGKPAAAAQAESSARRVVKPLRVGIDGDRPLSRSFSRGSPEHVEAEVGKPASGSTSRHASVEGNNAKLALRAEARKAQLWASPQLALPLSLLLDRKRQIEVRMGHWR